jgi:pantoate--beta-alanine ligase
MEIVKTIDEVRVKVKQWKREGNAVGFVPTMGFLHEGHESLIKQARKENDKVVVSIFVNPTQFAPTEDLESYPRDLEHDAILCENAGADLIFHPEASQMYDEKASTIVEVKGLTTQLCGKSRPTHFGGVCLVVSKLFHIVNPDRAYFGEKDAQQLAVIKRMAKDLDFGIEIIGCPIIREEDGLAKSSRNTYLSLEERQAATILSKSLVSAKQLIVSGEKNAKQVKKQICTMIEQEPLARIDYIEVVDFDTIQPIEEIKGPILVAIAVFIGKTRLIDNFIIKEER